MRDEIGQSVFDLGDRFAELSRNGQPVERRVFEDQPLQRQNALGQLTRAHQLERIEFTGAQDELLRPERA